MYTLPIFYYPSTTILVDDDELFLKSTSQLLCSHKIKKFHDPNDCLKFFDSYIKPLGKMALLRGATEDDRYDLINHSPVDFNVPMLNQIYHFEERFDEISVIIVDYKMPGMMGIDLCKKLHSQPAKKILLTGEATHDEAIRAFNDNTIDRYIRKDSPTLVSDIQMYVAELKKQYFQERTKSVLSHLEAENKLPLSDQTFIDFFQKSCLEYSIKEYYLIDKNGSLMLINNENVMSYLIIHTDRSLNKFIELNEEIIEAKPFINLIAQRQSIPFFGIGKESWQFEIDEWSKHLYSAKMIDGKEKYYFSLVN